MLFSHPRWYAFGPVHGAGHVLQRADKNNSD